ncbi:MAG: DNA repair protein RadC [Anaerolineaceae bacterium]|nr:DNA repair protein RadC [Anaerolineaceae bacterium]
MLRLHDLPTNEQPRERLRQVGERALSTTELLALVLGSGNASDNVLSVAQYLLAEVNGLPGLSRASLAELKTIRGIGDAKASRLKASLELGRRLLLTARQERPYITSPGDAANLLMPDMMHLEQEHLRLVLLDTRNRLLGTPTIYVGSLNTSVIRIGELFRAALRENAAAFIIAHNHPSSDPSPSPEDIAVTRKIVEAGQLMSVEVIDHIIIGQNCFVSLRERGYGFDQKIFP